MPGLLLVISPCESRGSIAIAVNVQPGAAPPPKPPFWNDRVWRGLFFQALVILLVVAAGAFLINNTIANLAKQNIASGFDFLNTTAGFSIGETLITYQESDTYGRAFLVGLANTLIVSFYGVIFATILGFVIGVARLSPNWLVSKLARVYRVKFASTCPC